MKVIKIILIAIASIIAIVLIAAAFVKKDYDVEREIVINKPKTEVFEYIKYLKNQENYSPWSKMDPNMKTTYTGTDAQVGFISAWDSKIDSVGSGEQEIKKITPYERIDLELRFFKPFESTEQVRMVTTELQNNQTKLVWGFSGRLPYPFNLWHLFMDFDQMMGKDLEQGLKTLKTILETNEKD